MLTYGASLRLEPVRIGVRVLPDARDEPAERAVVARFDADDLEPGVRRVGPVQIALARTHHGDAATYRVRVENPGTEPVFLQAVGLGFRFTGAAADALRYVKNGWQSWSYDGTRELDGAGEPEFPSGPWLRGMHHALGERPADRAGWHESATVTAVGGGALGAPGGACVAGVFERDCAFGVVYLQRDPSGGVRVEVELVLEVPLAPGESRALDDVRVAIGDDPNELLESFATLWGRAADARTASPFRVGWCSWYHFFHDVTEADLLRNVDALARARDEIPVEVVQLDDGYQHAIGDWLRTNDKFPNGLAAVARAIRGAGFTAGLWTAPFAVVAESDVFRSHPEWLLRDPDDARPFRGTLHDVWTKERWVHALDTTQPVVLDHLESLFRELRDMGFAYQKLDFLHVAAMRAESSAPGVTRAARLRRGLEAIRRGAGDDAFLLGCGCPMGPAVGIVDAMRIGPDVAPHWETRGGVPGIEETLPSTAGAVRSTLHRAWMHRRLWLNDPDCLMARTEKTQLSADETRTLAAAIAATGGMVVFSDDVPLLDAASRSLVRACAAAAAEVDATDRPARVVDLLARPDPGVVQAARGLDSTICLVNRSDEPWSARVPFAALSLADGASPVPALDTSESAAEGAPRVLRAELAPHASAFARVDGARSLAVFCDFDGTFSLQDVGSTLAKRHLPDRRDALWKRYENGELTAWRYTHALLDGFDLPAAQVDEFLRTVELDPGSLELVAWCRERGVPFRIVSDGFGRNLEVLERLHGVEFFYYANRLVFREDRWKIEPGYPNDACGCGTGTCKRGVISAYRDAHPDAFCVHVGNGRVSDLCGARVADLVFARRGETDTLGPALEERGLPFVWFDTLRDVVRGLEALVARAKPAPSG